MSRRAATLRDLALLALLRLALTAVAWQAGFRAVSDDDFARVVHAQEWAHAPALDPTGTSWLPFPFWLNGSVMLLFGTDLTVARAVAILLAVLSTFLLYAAARLLLDNPRDALLGAAIATVLPWSIRLGIATVPELPTAALTLFAIATIARRRHHLLGAAALLLATLSRYEPWPIAAAFAALCLWDLAGEVPQLLPPPAGRSASNGGSRAPAAERNRTPPKIDTSPQPTSPTSPGALLAAAALALAGPILWIAHNARAHGDPFHFLARVSAYKKAHGTPTDVFDYPLSVLREEPELAVGMAVTLACLLLTKRQPQPRPPWRRTLPRTALLLTAMLATLTTAAIRGGAPTHHAGRAVLVIWLAAAIYLAPATRAALSPSHHPRRRATFAVLLLATIPTAALILRPWFSRLDDFTPRHDEVAIGRAAATLTTPTDRILILSPDYRHFAIQAATARPWRITITRPLAPCCIDSPSSQYEALQARITEIRPTLLLTPAVIPADPPLGAPLTTTASWSAHQVPDR